MADAISFHRKFIMSKSTFTAYSALTNINNSVSLANMANMFEFTASRMLTIWTILEQSTLVKLVKARHIMTRYLMWEGDVSTNFNIFHLKANQLLAKIFILPWVALCEGMNISPPLSWNLWFVVLCSVLVRRLNVSRIEVKVNVRWRWS